MKAMKALVLFTFIFCLVFVSACSSAKTPAATDTPAVSATPAPATETPAATEASATTEPVKDVTIKYSRWASGEEEKNFRAWLDEFMKSHPHIKVEAEFLPFGPYFQKIKTDLIAGTAADVMSTTYGDFYSYTQSNVFVDLNSFADSKDVLGQLIDGTVQGFNVDGKQLGAPIGVGRRLPFLNKDLFAKANVPLPSQTDPMTSAQWVDMLKKLQAGLGKGFKASNLFPEELLDTLTASAGARLVSVDGKKVTVNTPEGIKAVQAFKDIMTSGGQVLPLAQIWAGAYGNPDSAVSTGKVAVGWTGNWSIGAMKTANLKFMSIPAPIVEGGKVAQSVYLNGEVIPASSKNKEAAWELLKWMLSKEGQLSFGKFSDSPVHKDAAKESQDSLTAQDKDAYTGYAAAATSAIPFPATPAELGTLQGKLLGDLVTGKITAEQFAQQYEKDGQPLIDKYQANIGK